MLLLPKRSLIAVIHDVLMASISLLVALYLRLGSDAWSFSEPFLLTNYIIFMACFVSSVLLFKLHREVWRYVSIHELSTLTKVVTLSIVLTYGILFFTQRLEGIPRSLPLLQWMVLGTLLSAPRVLYRIINESGAKRIYNSHDVVNVLVVGANDHAEMFIRMTQRSGATPYEVVAILDRKTTRDGRAMRGVSIYSGLETLERVIQECDKKGKKPQRLILTDEYIDTQTAGVLLPVCEKQGVSLARLPKLTDLQTGDAVEVHPVAIEDLLGRAQSEQDLDSMKELIADNIVLVTGAGGSIGSELVRQIAHCSPARLVLLEQNEFNLYQIDKELALHHPDIVRHTVLCDIRDRDALQHVVQTYQPSIVFHAAALKHVPLAEKNPSETMLTNIFGTRNVAEIAVEAAVSHMVLISTDKAVHPANVMGATKRLAEAIWADVALHSKKTRAVMVRFGNVLGSTGSVIPLFQEQLRAGGPLTVTHQDMERYFMTIREAAGLVVQAAALSDDLTALYILDMGEPVKILDLAEQMIRLANYTPYEDVDIVFTGLRAGEKLSEELVYDGESLEATNHPAIRRSRNEVQQGLDTSLLDELHKACIARNAQQANNLLQQLVKEYRPLHTQHNG